MAKYTAEEEAEIRAQMALSEHAYKQKQDIQKRRTKAFDKAVRMKLNRDLIADNFNTGVAKAAAKILKKEENSGAGYEYNLIMKGYRRADGARD